ncbi:sulfatase-like hydrolase/transferase [Maribellus comscasis]|uniref:Sulfatase-like hydrolase/transferase n=1 Tax=Maribellus comscasis TaxID=2681766 RepID=A0A6I6JU19_9BACT|nr:sulfatase [Maribellus comscasis]QGY43677.1 sulfatase-like hydrolase/transferase [Maribellus comscasis]
MNQQKLYITLIFSLLTLFNIAQKPNFVIIFTDDQGYGDVGCYGNKNIRTPNIDKMAAEGMLFTDFYVAASVCTPSRAALLTGCYPQRVGLPSVLFPNNMPLGQKNGMAYGLNPEEITLAELLKAKDYRTACIGKWHLGNLPDFMPMNHGFDEYFGLPYSNDMGDMIPDNSKYNFSPLPLIEGTQVIELNPDQNLLVKRYTEQAVSFIEKNQDHPFFLYLAHSMPHRPCHVSDSLSQMRFSTDQLSNIDGEDKKSRDFLYPAAIEELDWSVGVVLEKLKTLGLDENTLVIFTSDNGPAVGSAGALRGKKGTMYEGGLRVPCVMYWKGKIAEGNTCNQLVASIDLYPTFASLAGIELPEDRIIDGEDVSSLILGKKIKNGQRPFFYFNQNQGCKAVRFGDWKFFPGHSPHLYNLKEDIGETNNRYPEFPEIAKQMAEKISDFESDLAKNKRLPGLVDINR